MTGTAQPERRAIGIDIGGTKIAVAAVDGRGAIRASAALATEAELGFDRADRRCGRADRGNPRAKSRLEQPGGSRWRGQSGAIVRSRRFSIGRLVRVALTLGVRIPTINAKSDEISATNSRNVL